MAFLIEETTNQAESQQLKKITSESRVENQPTYDGGSGNRARVTLGEGECSHLCANPATKCLFKTNINVNKESKANSSRRKWSLSVGEECYSQKHICKDFKSALQRKTACISNTVHVTFLARVCCRPPEFARLTRVM